MDDDTMDCPHCQGDGFAPGAHGDLSDLCPRCHGTGTVVRPAWDDAPHLELSAIFTADGDDRPDPSINYAESWDDPFQPRRRG
jgi:hypothetical protein